MNSATRVRPAQLPDIARLCLRTLHNGKKKPTTGFQGPDGHGEKIWVFSHRRSDQIIYSFKEQLDGFHGLKQLPFNGKKTKPAKLRKDYWSPLATIEFPQGQGSIGRSVFQKLRELKHLHEVAWTEEVRYKTPDEFTDKQKLRHAEEEAKGNSYRPIRTKQERGFALNAQKANSIADIAAVLAGQGRGNKVAAAPEKLVPVTVNWANDQDKGFAEEWSTNVTHGLFEEPAYVAEEAAKA